MMADGGPSERQKPRSARDGAPPPARLSSVVNAAGRYVPNTASSSLIVAVRVRPMLKAEAVKGGNNGRKDILRLMDERVVLVLDPDESKASKPFPVHQSC
jgi:hypothetical protein